MTKESIPEATILEVWLNYCFKYDVRICKCVTCITILARPKSLKGYIRDIDDENERFRFHGIKGLLKAERHAEMGHIISEKNGGSIDPSNLVVQCSYCNKTGGSKNIDYIDRDVTMIDVSGC